MVENLGKNWRMTRTVEGQGQQGQGGGGDGDGGGVGSRRRTEEEEVGDAAELFEEVLEDKVVDGVLGGEDLVGGIDPLGLGGALLAVEGIVGERLVEVDGARGGRGALLAEGGLGVEVDGLDPVGSTGVPWLAGGLEIAGVGAGEALLGLAIVLGREVGAGAGQAGAGVGSEGRAVPDGDGGSAAGQPAHVGDGGGGGGGGGRMDAGGASRGRRVGASGWAGFWLAGWRAG